jgi:hypothetical protein
MLTWRGRLFRCLGIVLTLRMDYLRERNLRRNYRQFTQFCNIFEIFSYFKKLSILLWKKTVLIDKQIILFSINSEMFCFSFLYLSYSGHRQSQTTHILLTSLILS